MTELKTTAHGRLIMRWNVIQFLNSIYIESCKKKVKSVCKELYTSFLVSFSFCSNLKVYKIREWIFFQKMGKFFRFNAFALKM